MEISFYCKIFKITVKNGNNKKYYVSFQIFHIDETREDFVNVNIKGSRESNQSHKISTFYNVPFYNKIIL